jgi:hypothetical protein
MALNVIDQLESQFERIEKKLVATRTSIELKCAEHESSCVGFLLEHFVNRLNHVRETLIESLNKHLEMLLKQFADSSLRQIIRLFDSKLLFVESQKVFNTPLILQLFELIFNREKLILNFKYFDLHSTAYLLKETQTTKSTPSPVNQPKCLRIVVSSEKVFYFVEMKNRQCFMQIKNKQDQVLIKSASFYLRFFEHYQLLADEKYVLILVYDEVIAKLYLFNLNNNEFNLSASRTFDCRINLHSMGKHEIVLYTNKINERYVALNYKLEQIDSFGQNVDQKKRFYFADASLIKCSFDSLYLKFYDAKTQLHQIKQFSRLSGKLLRTISFDTPPANRQLISFDSNGSFFVFKTLKSASIELYDTNGKYLTSVRSSLLNEIKSFEFFKHSDDAYLIDKDNRVCFLNFF